MTARQAAEKLGVDPKTFYKWVGEADTEQGAQFSV